MDPASKYKESCRRSAKKASFEEQASGGHSLTQCLAWAKARFWPSLFSRDEFETPRGIPAEEFNTKLVSVCEFCSERLRWTRWRTPRLRPDRGGASTTPCGSGKISPWPMCEKRNVLGSTSTRSQPHGTRRRDLRESCVTLAPRPSVALGAGRFRP